MARPVKRYLGGAALAADDLRELRPLRTPGPGGVERYTLPLIRELRGTPFELCPDEVHFATSMVDTPLNLGLRKHNLAIFRADQRRFCGDFICVDVSSPPQVQGNLLLPAWEVFVLDLKRGAPLQVGGGGAGIQLRNAADAAAVAHRLVATRAVGAAEAARLSWQRSLAPSRVWLLVGDRQEVLGFFRHLRHMRRAARCGSDPREVLGQLGVTSSAA